MKKLMLSVAVLALGSLAWALEDDIAQWIKDLASPDQATRDSAVASLEKAGGAAREALETASKSDDPEVAWQAARLLRRLKDGSRAEPDPQAPPDPQVPRRRPPAVAFVSRRIIISKDGRADIQENQDGHVVVKETRDGNTEEYQADSRAEFTEKYPEVAKKYGLDTGPGVVPAGEMDEETRARIEELRKAAERAMRDGNGEKDMEKLQEELRRALEERRSPRAGRGTLGVEIAPVDDALRYQLDIPEGGVVIKSVLKGSRAEKLGLAEADILLTLNGKPVSTSSDIRAAILAEGPATAEIVREGERQTLREK
ncbi:MAG: PDZ domain-containing protein [Planctomycetes bacterium]|nr:PDZ domain-containing protein [Planctomycetota bacterium]